MAHLDQPIRAPSDESQGIQTIQEIPTQQKAIRAKYLWVIERVFEALLATFAQEAGVGRGRIIVRVFDNAGWHGETNLKGQDLIRLLFLPPYTPELQPAEHLREVVDEPTINTHVADIETLDVIVSDRCAQLARDRRTIKGRAGFHWWLEIANVS